MADNFNYPDLMYIKMPHACFGLLAEHGTVTKAPPIAKYAKGWTVPKAWSYFAHRGGHVELWPGCYD